MIILDSPLTPASSPAEVAAWLVRLEEMARRHANDPEALCQIAIERAGALEIGEMINEWGRLRGDRAE